MIYLVHFANGASVRVASDKRLSLEQLQGIVGGYIEFAPGPNGNSFCVNEDGLGLGLQQNGTYPRFVGTVIEGRDVAGKEGTEFHGFPEGQLGSK